MRPIDIRKLVVRDAKVSDLRLSLDKDGNTILTRQPDNSAIGTAASRDTGTNPDEIPLNSDLGSAAYKTTGTGSGNVPLNSDLGSSSTVDTGTAPGQVPLNSDLGSASKVDTGTDFDQIPLNADIVYPVESVADLRLLTGISVGQKFYLDGHTIQGIGGGVLTATKLHTTETDDNGNLFVVNGVVIERKDTFPVNPVNFGALIDGSDSYAAIAAAIAVADDSGIVFTHPHSYSQKIVGVAPWVQEEGAALTYIGGAIPDATLEIGVEAVTTQSKKIVLDIQNDGIDWTDADFTGVRLINISNCPIEYRRVSGFTVGIQELGFNEGWAYNEITVGIILSCKTQIEWANKGNGVSGGPRGYHNENLYQGGRFTNLSASPTGVSRIGIRCYSIDGFNTSHNNNVMIKPSFELFDGGLPISMEAGTQNRFLEFRNEQNGDVFAQEGGDASNNRYIEGYSDKLASGDKLSSSSIHRDSVFISSRAAAKDHAQLFFESGNLRELVNYYSFNRVNTRKVQLFDGASGVTTPVSLTQSFAINSDSLSMTSATHGVGISVDTRRAKRFALRPNCAQVGGRFTIVCYDSAGAQITPVNGSTLFTMKSRTFSAETIFFGGYRFGVDIGADDDQWFQFTVDDTVDSIDIIFAAGAASLDLRSFAVYSFSNDDKATPVAYLKTCREYVNIGTGKPTQGVHRVHDRIDNAVPAVGQPQGWVCITAGDFAGSAPIYASKPDLLA